MIPPLVQVLPLGWGHGTVRFQSGRVVLLGSCGLILAHALQSPPSLFSTEHNPGSSMCGYPRSHSTLSVPEGRLHTGEMEPHTRRNEARNRRFAACVRSVGSACIVKGPLEPRTTAPKRAGRKVCWLIAPWTPQALSPLIQWSWVWEGCHGEVLVKTAGTQLHESLVTNPQGH